MKELTREREKGRKEYEDKIEKLDEEQKTMAEVIEKREIGRRGSSTWCRRWRRTSSSLT